MRVSRREDEDGEATGKPLEREIELDVIDALLPCRDFAITFKVAELGKMSLTSEFLLRLVHSVEGIPESEAASYFGFSEAEIAFVIGELEAADYLERRNGALWLSLAGRELFKGGSDAPEVYDVEQRTERHGFDLIALAPAEFFSLSPFDSVLPEFHCKSSEVAHASKAVPAAFRRHFDGLVRRVTDTPLKQSLYGVDTVTPLKRYATPIPMRVRTKADMPGMVEPDLTERWSRFELDDREKIVSAAAEFLKAARISTGPFDELCFQEILRVAPESLGVYAKGGVFKRDQFFRDAVRRVGELRVDRPTVLFVGTLFTDRNVARLNRALEYAFAQEPGDESAQHFFWHAPAVPTWGASRRLPQLLDAIANFGGEVGRPQRLASIGVLQDRRARCLERAFNHVVASHAQVLRLEPLEVFLVPGRVAAVAVHVPSVGSTDSYPVPLGVLSFDRNVVRRATELMMQLVLPSKMIKPGDAGDTLEAQIELALRL
jgi:hypothetical protein